MHIVKEGEVRKAEFIEAATGLFLQKGYDKTSLNDIIAKVGVTKGSFYYYFESKEALLDEIVNQVAGALIGETRARMEDPAVPLEQRLLKADLALAEYRITQSRSIKNFNEILINTNNAKLIHKAGRSLKEGMLPVFRNYLVQGKAQGILDPPDIDESSEVVLMLHQVFHKKLSQYLNQGDDHCLSESEMMKSVLFYQVTVGSILGAPEILSTLNEKIKAIVRK